MSENFTIFAPQNTFTMEKVNIEKYLKYCKYYKGEIENPFIGLDCIEPNSSMLWFYEMKWVGLCLAHGDILAEYEGDYNIVGSHFMEVDERPISLKALLFNRYAKTAWIMLDAVEPFMRFYIESCTEGKLRERLLQCRYYKGEYDCPEVLFNMANRACLFWQVEKYYTEGVFDKNEKEMLDFYFDCGLPDVSDKMPLLLAAGMFSYFCRYSDVAPQENAKFFNDVVLPEYLSVCNLYKLWFKPSYNYKSFREYLDKCRYYNGEFEIPMWVKEIGKEIFWDYERIWVQKHFLKDGETIKSNEKFFKDLIRYYKKQGLGHFNDRDGVPISFKAMLLNRYEHWEGGTPDGFKDWYREQYMKMPKEWCLKQCLFYRGEDKCPEILLQQKSAVWAASWHMEKLWADGGGIVPIEYSDQYFSAGLSDFNRDDGVHRGLKEFLYGYGLHRAEGMLKPEEFIEWYDNQYIPLGRAYRNNDLR